MDLSAILRVSVLPKDSALDVAKHGSMPSFASPSMALINSFDEAQLQNFSLGVDELIPDWGSLRVCTFYPAHGIVMCAVREPPAEIRCSRNEKDKEDGGRADDGFDLCARVALSKQVERAATAGQSLLIGMEMEFLLYKPDAFEAHMRPKHTASFNTTSLYDPETTGIIDEIVNSLGRAGIKVIKYCLEPGAHSNFEIVLAPLPPMEAADAMVYCRETIKTTVRKRGYGATLMPLPFEQGSSSLGAHINLSISDPGEDNSKGSSFLSGILESLCGFAAVANPSPRVSAQSINRSDLYRHVRWGENNKGCIVRQRRPGLWEVRNPDSTMNPYMAFATLIAAGMAGLESQKPLTMKPMPGNFALLVQMSDEQKAEYGVKEALPESLGAALDRLKKDKGLRDSLGERLVEAYVGVKEKEIKSASALTALELSERLMKVF
jgi:glutamine synthetase